MEKNLVFFKDVLSIHQSLKVEVLKVLKVM